MFFLPSAANDKIRYLDFFLNFILMAKSSDYKVFLYNKWAVFLKVFFLYAFVTLAAIVFSVS